MSEQGQKTEQPTEKRLREAHEEGNFAKSPDIQMVCVLLAGYFVISFGAREYCETIAGIAVGIFGHLGKHAIRAEGVVAWATPAAKVMLGLVMPMAMACAGAGALAGGMQSRFQLTAKVLSFDLSRLDPMKGFQRLFSGQGTVKAATDSAKLAVVVMVVYGAVRQIMADPIFFSPVEPSRLGGFMLQSATTLLGRFVLALSGIAGLNYFYQFRKTSENLMMTKQEVKEESRSSEGDPKIKAAQRQMARRLLQKQMLSAVPTADVIVTNPTHFAVALRYERGMDKAPVVLAKGADAFARRIKALAAEHSVPMVENKPVARMLYKYGKVGKAIPVQMYQAVADILAFVYKTHRYYFHQLRARRSATR